MPRTTAPRLTTFGLTPGRLLAGKYVVASRLGSGFEGEVYKVIEKKTGAPRAAKLFFPHRNERDRAVTTYAQRMERLRRCPIILKYHHSEEIEARGVRTTAMISEFVEGVLLDRFARSQTGARLRPFAALSLLHEIATGLECVHRMGEYHGDMHVGNVLVRRVGVRFDVRLVDMYDWGRPSAANIREDVFNLVRILYDITGGRRWYAKQTPEIKAVCLGLKRTLIAKKFPTTRALREHLESFEWSDG